MNPWTWLLFAAVAVLAVTALGFIVAAVVVTVIEKTRALPPKTTRKDPHRW